MLDFRAHSGSAWPVTGPVPAQADGAGAAGAPLDSLEDVQETALASINDLFDSFVAHIPYVVGAMAILLLTWGLTRLIDFLGHRLLGHWKKRESVKELILRLASILVTVLGLLLTAIVLFPGLTPSKALGGLGLVSIAVGLAFKDIFENFFAGILILWRFPFERGDYIHCENIVGRVERVLVRMSYIRLTTGELVVEEALGAAVAGDMAPIEALAEVLRDPFTRRDGLDAYENGPPAGAPPHVTFCGT